MAFFRGRALTRAWRTTQTRRSCDTDSTLHEHVCMQRRAIANHAGEPGSGTDPLAQDETSQALQDKAEAESGVLTTFPQSPGLQELQQESSSSSDVDAAEKPCCSHANRAVDIVPHSQTGTSAADIASRGGQQDKAAAGKADAPDRGCNRRVAGPTGRSELPEVTVEAGRRVRELQPAGGAAPGTPCCGTPAAEWPPTHVPGGAAAACVCAVPPPPEELPRGLAGVGGPSPAVHGRGSVKSAQLSRTDAAAGDTDIGVDAAHAGHHQGVSVAGDGAHVLPGRPDEVRRPLASAAPRRVVCMNLLHACIVPQKVCSAHFDGQ